MQEAGGLVTGLDNTPFTLRTRDMLCSQGDPVHSDILHILEEVDALGYMEEVCELPDFLNVKRTRLEYGAKPKTLWYDENRGQN